MVATDEKVCICLYIIFDTQFWLFYSSTDNYARFHEKSFRLVRLLKHLHPSWGVPYIITRVKECYPALPLQSVRHYQRRLGLATGKVPQPTLPKVPPQSRPRQPHDEWEVDAKERIEFDGGKQKACFLNITDAKTNAQLKAEVFPPRQD